MQFISSNRTQPTTEITHPDCWNCLLILGKNCELSVNSELSEYLKSPISRFDKKLLCSMKQPLNSKIKLNLLPKVIVSYVKRQTRCIKSPDKVSWLFEMLIICFVFYRAFNTGGKLYQLVCLSVSLAAQSSLFMTPPDHSTLHDTRRNPHLPCYFSPHCPQWSFQSRPLTLMLCVEIQYLRQ